MTQPASQPDPVILREDPLSPTATGLAGRLERLGFEVALVAEDAELKAQLTRFRGPQALLVNTSLSPAEIGDALGIARAGIEAGQVTPLAVGPGPSMLAREALEAGGVTLAALEPLDDATLRFQVNRAFLGKRGAGRARCEMRVPWEAPIGLTCEGRERRADLYNLSRYGAFLETVRPPRAGSRVELSLPLAVGPARLLGEVVHCNAPGNLRRRRAPVGIGVRFEALAEPTLTQLDAAIADRCADLLL